MNLQTETTSNPSSSASPITAPENAAQENSVVETKKRLRSKQLVTPPEGVTSAEAQAFYACRLAFETDPADVHHDVSKGVANFVIVDARQKEAYDACRIPGAIHLPYARIRPSTTSHFDPKTLFVTYCWGPGCNSSTKAAMKLSELGFAVRDMIGGIEYWRREGYAVEGTDADSAPLTGSR